jgi:alpha,alpha-trehalose phosphorylase
VALTVRGTSYVVTRSAPLVVELDGQGDRIDGLLGDHPVIGGTRADGSTITAGVPDPILPPEEFDATGEIPIYVPETTAAQGAQF